MESDNEFHRRENSENITYAGCIANGMLTCGGPISHHLAHQPQLFDLAQLCFRTRRHANLHFSIDRTNPHAYADGSYIPLRL
jgi:hypothetical protein